MIFREVSLSIFFIVFYGRCVLSLTVPHLTVPPNVFLECNTTTPNITGYANASGNCNNNIVVVNYHDVVDPSSTIFTIVRTWTATDSCGNASNSQTIQVQDNIAPTIEIPETYLTWCNYTEGTLGKNITDNCDDLQQLHINYTNSQSTSNLACPQDYSFTQFWSAVDQSGNEAQITSTIIGVQVVTAIIWGYLPGPVTVVCSSGVYPNITGMAIAFDQCSRLVPVTWVDSVSPYCNTTALYQFKRTFYAMRCGVQLSYGQTISVLPEVFPPAPQSLGPSPTGPPEPHSVNQQSPEPGVPTSEDRVPSGPTPPDCPCPNGFCFGGTECLSCQTGYFGTYCAQKCYCQNGICDDGVNGNGYCLVCKQGSYGAACDSLCSCTNGVCNDGTDGDGSCLGCSKGYYGVNCQLKCICDDGSCDDGPTGTGVCLDSLYVSQSASPNTVAPFLVGVIIILVFLFIFFVGLAIGLFLYYRFKTEKHIFGINYRKNKDSEAKSENKPLFD